MLKIRRGSRLGGGGRLVRTAVLCIAVLAPVLAASGCAGNPEPRQLGRACAVRPCTCVDTNVAWWRKAQTSEPLWTVGGQAYCPDGYDLRLTEANR
jgi:hypothetical protein